MTSKQNDSIEVAMLPLGDGRLVMVPLIAIAEVKQLEQVSGGEGDALGHMDWRELSIPVASLDVICGLDAPKRESMESVAVFKASADADAPFQALAFTGTAAHRRVSASIMEAAEIPASGHFSGATRIGEQVFLIPDLPKVLFAA